MSDSLSPVWLSVATSLTATLITCVCGTALAGWRLRRSGVVFAVLDGFFILPLVLPPTVVGFLLLLLFGRNGPLGRALWTLGVSVVFSWPATVIAATVVSFPLMYITARASLEQVDSDCLDAARTLGASEWRVFRRVALPLAAPGLIAGTVLSFARAFGEFGATLMLAGDIPGKTETLPLAIYFAVEAGETMRAVEWCVIDVMLSLFLLFVLYAWTHKQFPARARRSAWVKMGLEVDIEKQLESYTLRVSFRANDKPLSILGASGAGKSMTLRCVAGLERPDRGRIVLNERVLFDSEKKIDLPARERRVGIVFQKYALLPNLTVEQNIGFGLDQLSQADRDAKVQKYVGDAHLQGLEKRLPEQISGGEQQRVALARALAVDPEALLLDEPLSALDTYLRQQVERQLALTLAASCGTTLFVTHNIDEAYRIGSEMLVLSRGEVVASGPKRQIFEHPPTLGVAQLTGCKNLSEARAISPHVIEATDWNCKLNVAQGSEGGKHVGIRAHHVEFQEDGAGAAEANSFPCWVVSTSETTISGNCLFATAQSAGRRRCASFAGRALPGEI